MAGEADPILALGACDLRDRIASGALKTIEVVEAYIAQIEAREPEVQAWAWFDPEFARAQARQMDAYRGSGRALGALHGVPVGLKDVIDTAGIPTENGTTLDEGRIPARDAYVVDRLKQAGAIIMGKTVTAELAFLHPGKTRNPHDAAHTPGGSSSGSAAAVAAAMVPLAVGTQTGGSVIRPAAFCGVTGFKPTFGAIPRRGVLMQSPSLDTLGVFARTPIDASLLADVLIGYDADDPASAPVPSPQILRSTQGAAPLPPVFALLHPPGWERADPQTRDALSELAAALGEQVFEVPLPNAFDEAAAQRECINFAEMARCYFTYGRDGLDSLSPEMQGALDTGGRILARDYLAALDWRDVLYTGLAQILQRADALLCPAALGPAPRDLSSTGDSIFNGLWTLCGTPAVTIPALTSSEGLPMGVQLVGARGNDARLMRAAHWLYDWTGQ